ncbi:hypothetical protein GW17_00030490 [Ensete ventricosum]|nr:hypothetical protein GW17_00030490 [Ensete ventricosum]
MPPQDQAPMKDTDLEQMLMNLKEGDRYVVNHDEGLTVVDFDDHVSLAEKEGAGMAKRRFGQSQVQASGRGLDDTVGNSPGVHRELTKGLGSLPGWRKGIHRKKIETRQKIVGVAERLVGSWEGLEVDL